MHTNALSNPKPKSRPRPPVKPEWPYKKVKLTANVAANQWVKKIRNKTHTFGVLWDGGKTSPEKGSGYFIDGGVTIKGS